MEMKFVKQLKEADSAEQAEALIAEGWTLIAVVPTTRPNGWNLPCYILGRGTRATASSQPLRM